MQLTEFFNRFKTTPEDQARQKKKYERLRNEFPLTQQQAVRICDKLFKQVKSEFTRNVTMYDVSSGIDDIATITLTRERVKTNFERVMGAEMMMPEEIELFERLRKSLDMKIDAIYRIGEGLSLLINLELKIFQLRLFDVAYMDFEKTGFVLDTMVCLPEPNPEDLPDNEKKEGWTIQMSLMKIVFEILLCRKLMPEEMIMKYKDFEREIFEMYPELDNKMFEPYLDAYFKKDENAPPLEHFQTVIRHLKAILENRNNDFEACQSGDEDLIEGGGVSSVYKGDRYAAGASTGIFPMGKAELKHLLENLKKNYDVKGVFVPDDYKPTLTKLQTAHNALTQSQTNAGNHHRHHHHTIAASFSDSTSYRNLMKQKHIVFLEEIGIKSFDPTRDSQTWKKRPTMITAILHLNFHNPLNVVVGDIEGQIYTFQADTGGCRSTSEFTGFKPEWCMQIRAFAAYYTPSGKQSTDVMLVAIRNNLVTTHLFNTVYGAFYIEKSKAILNTHSHSTLLCCAEFKRANEYPLIFVGCYKNKVLVLDPEVKDEPVVYKVEGPVYCMTFSGDNKSLICGSESFVYVYELVKKNEESGMELKMTFRSMNEVTCSLNFSSRTNSLCMVTYGLNRRSTVQVVDWENTGRVREAELDHHLIPTATAFLRDGKYALCYYQDNGLRLYQLDDGQEPVTLVSLQYTAAFSSSVAGMMEYPEDRFIIVLTDGTSVVYKLKLPQ